MYALRAAEACFNIPLLHLALSLHTMLGEGRGQQVGAPSLGQACAPYCKDSCPSLTPKAASAAYWRSTCINCWRWVLIHARVPAQGWHPPPGPPSTPYLPTRFEIPSHLCRKGAQLMHRSLLKGLRHVQTDLVKGTQNMGRNIKCGRGAEGVNVRMHPLIGSGGLMGGGAPGVKECVHKGGRQ